MPFFTIAQKCSYIFGLILQGTLKNRPIWSHWLKGPRSNMFWFQHQMFTSKKQKFGRFWVNRKYFFPLPNDVAFLSTIGTGEKKLKTTSSIKLFSSTKAEINFVLFEPASFSTNIACHVTFSSQRQWITWSHRLEIA